MCQHRPLSVGGLFTRNFFATLLELCHGRFANTCGDLQMCAEIFFFLFFKIRVLFALSSDSQAPAVRRCTALPAHI